MKSKQNRIELVTRPGGDGAGLDDVRVFRVRDLFSPGGNDGQTLHERGQAMAGSHEDVGQRHLCPRHSSPTFCGGQVKSLSHFHDTDRIINLTDPILTKSDFKKRANVSHYLPVSKISLRIELFE